MRLLSSPSDRGAAESVRRAIIRPRSATETQGGRGCGKDGTLGPETRAGVSGRMHQALLITLRDRERGVSALGSHKAGAVSARRSRPGALAASDPAQ
jgi:hypothetical protein